MKKKSKVSVIAKGLTIPVVILIAWIIVTAKGQIPIGILPTVPMVGQAFKELVVTGQLREDLLLSLSRVLKGYLLAAVIGIVLGSFAGMFENVRQLITPIITVIRQIPIIAWIPLIILWAGIGETSKVIIIALAAFFPILMNTESGMSGTPGGYVEVAKLYNLNLWETFTKVYFPHAIPSMLVGLKLGLSTSWMAVVAAEMIASSSGIGYRLTYARSMMEANIVIACMVIIGLVGVAMDKLIGWGFSYITPWKKVEKKQG